MRKVSRVVLLVAAAAAAGGCAGGQSRATGLSQVQPASDAVATQDAPQAKSIVPMAMGDRLGVNVFYRQSKQVAQASFDVSQTRVASR